MTPQILQTLVILGIAIVLLFSEWLRVDLVALLVLGGLALSGLVTPAEALSGFSSPAVVTVWAVFILSAGLSKTGIANLLGSQVMRLSGQGEARLLIVIMLTAGLMSAFMNNVGVAALLLPVVIHIARRTGRAPSKLLMPLAFGALLGGLTTLIGTPPNILASDALRDFGLTPFSFFDFTPVGLAVMLSGIAFMALIGHRLLPERDITREMGASGSRALGGAFELKERMFVVQLPADSPLAGRTLAESRIGSATGLTVIGIIRNGQTSLSPEAGARLQAGDRLLVSGRIDRLDELRSQQLDFGIEEGLSVESLVSEQIRIAEVGLASDAAIVGKTLQQIDFRRRFGVNVLGILRDGEPLRASLPEVRLQASDILLVQGGSRELEAIDSSSDLHVTGTGAAQVYSLHEMLFALEVPQGSALAGLTLVESRLGDAYGLTVLGILRNGEAMLMPAPTEKLFAGDTLLVEGRRENLALIRGLQKLVVDQEQAPDLSDLESESVGLVEAVLAPQTKLVGKTLRQVHFREKYGLSILAIWREGRAYRSNLRDMALRFGDAFLLHGPRKSLKVLASDPDFLLLSEEIQEAPRLNKAPLATVIMALVVLSVLLGWLQIAIAAVIGASLMVLTRCLSMEEAYHAIEWRAVFLIAGMLPLGIAMEKSGAASFLAGGVVGLVGAYGPLAVIAGLFLLTTLASQFMPNPVVTVLMAPIAVNTAVSLDISPYTLMMAVAIAASASFLSPVGHPANVLIMGPGGYRIKDYMRVGAPLTLLVLIVSLLVLPLLWPL